MDTRRLLLAFALSFFVILVWSYLQPPIVEPPPEPPVAAEEGTTAGDAGTAEPSTAADPSAADPSAPGDVAPAAGNGDAAVDAAAPPAVPDVVGEREQPVVIETATSTVQWTNRGAQLVSYQIHRETDEGGESLDLVRRRGTDPYLFALFDPDGAPLPLNEALFTVDVTRDAEGADVVTFRHRSAAGAAAKVFRLRPDGLMDVEITVAGKRDWRTRLGPGLRNPTPEEDDRFLQRKVSWRRGEESETLNPEKQNETTRLDATGVQWATLEDSYFLSAIVPQAGVDELIFVPFHQRGQSNPGVARFAPVGGEVAESDEDGSTVVALDLRARDETVQLATFFGAKRYDELRKLPYGLEQTVRWGMFGIVVRPLYFGLEWLHANLIANYGWAIVAMTFLIRLLFVPLTHKSQKSMEGMRELSPKVQALRSKYRPKLKDKQGRINPEAQRQMNEEMMALYKEAGVNPAMGCLPMLIQLPVFYGFFKLLSTAVELRGAPWVGWIHDLSRPDPYYLLPLGMLVTAVLLQRLTPAPPDPMQKRIMAMMPIMFGFFSLYFPAGLVLYWMTNNLLSMAQQAFYRQRREAEPADDKDQKTPKKASKKAKSKDEPAKKKVRRRRA